MAPRGPLHAVSPVPVLPGLVLEEGHHGRAPREGWRRETHGGAVSRGPGASVLPSCARPGAGKGAGGCTGRPRPLWALFTVRSVCVSHLSVGLSVIWSSPRRPPVTRHPSLAHRQSTALSRVPSATKHSRRVYSKPAGASERPRWAIPRLACVNPAGPGGHRPRRVARPAL